MLDRAFWRLSSPPMQYRERTFDWTRDLPLRRGRSKALRMTRSMVATSKRIPYAPMGDYIWRMTKQVLLSGPIEDAKGYALTVVTIVGIAMLTLPPLAPQAQPGAGQLFDVHF